MFKHLLLIVLIQNVLLVESKFDRWHVTAQKIENNVRTANLLDRNHIPQLKYTLQRSVYAQGGVAITSRSLVELWVKASLSNITKVSGSLTSAINKNNCWYFKGKTGIENILPGSVTMKNYYKAHVQCQDDAALNRLYSDATFASIVIDARFVRNTPTKNKLSVTRNNFGAKFGTHTAPLKRSEMRSEAEVNATMNVRSEKRQISRVFQNRFPENPAVPCLGNADSHANWYMDALNNDHGIPDCKTLREIEQSYHCEYVKDAGAEGTVFVIDTGVDTHHPEFDQLPNLNTWGILDPADVDQASGEDMVNDFCAHGTALASMIIGRNHGVAPNALVFTMKVLGMQCSIIPSYAFIVALEIIQNEINSGMQRPHMIVSGLTHIEEAATCGWTFSAFPGPLAVSNCAYENTFKYLEYIYSGGIYVTAAGNGMEYYRDPLFNKNPTFIGFDICDWAVFSNNYAYDVMYYPMYMLDGSEFQTYFGLGGNNIRPIRTGSHDQNGYNAKFAHKNYFYNGPTMPESSTLSVGGSNYGAHHPYNSNVRCVDYHAATAFMESFAVPMNPWLTMGSWEDCEALYGPSGCPDTWNGGSYYEHPANEFHATGRIFWDGYMTGGYSANSFSTSLVGVALMATVLRHHDYFKYAINKYDVTREAINLLDIDINYDETQRIVNTNDEELTNSYESLDNSYGRYAIEGVYHTEASGGLPLDKPKNKNVRMRCTKHYQTQPNPYDNIDLIDFP